jgi:Zn-dependent peptidase ImmA (M78 family)
MDTKKKGDELENQTFAVFQRQIDEDRFFSKSEYCKIFQKKGYYSKDREKDIIFDVSIEITLPKQDRFSLLFLIECKNYSHCVQVDEVEEFFAKIQQVSGANAKGIIVSTNSFQDSAFTFAKSKGIGLLRYFSKDELEWILARSPFGMASSAYAVSERSNAYMALRDGDYKSRYFDFYGCVDEMYTVSSNHFFSALAQNGTKLCDFDGLNEIEQVIDESQISVPYREMEEIEAISCRILSEVGYKSGEVLLDEICEALNSKNGLIVERNHTLQKGILGQVSFNPNVIYIDDLQASTIERTRFTLAHEIGHFALEHYRYMLRETCCAEDIDVENSGRVTLEDIRRLEWQANYFASCLLLPKEQFEKEFLRQVIRLDLSNRGYGLLYLDEQKCNIDTFYKVTYPLMRSFHVSRSVVKYRLLKLGFLNEKKRVQKNSFQAIQALSRSIL